MQHQEREVAKKVYTREFHRFAVLMASAFHGLSQKNQHPLLSLTSLIKPYGLTKSLQDVLFSLGICSSYRSFYRQEQKNKAIYEAEIFEKMKIGGGVTWFDNFSRIYPHSSVLKGAFFQLSTNPARDL